MGSKPHKEKILERTAALFDIPGQVMGLPVVELTGTGQLRMENHRGILAYGENEILVSGGGVLIRVRGEGLELKAMTAGELLITGTVRCVELE